MASDLDLSTVNAELPEISDRVKSIDKALYDDDDGDSIGQHMGVLCDHAARIRSDTARIATAMEAIAKVLIEWRS